MNDFDIIIYIYNALKPLNVPVIEGWYDEELNKTHITAYEFLMQEDLYEDDEADCIQHNIQIDVWSKDAKEADTLKHKVIKLLKEADMFFVDSADFYEIETELYHKALRFAYNEIL